MSSVFWPCLRTATVNGVSRPTFWGHFWGTYIDKLPVVFFKYRHSNENACGFNNRLYIVTSGTAIDRVSRSCFSGGWWLGDSYWRLQPVCRWMRPYEVLQLYRWLKHLWIISRKVLLTSHVVFLYDYYMTEIRISEQKRKICTIINVSCFLLFIRIHSL